MARDKQNRSDEGSQAGNVNGGGGFPPSGGSSSQSGTTQDQFGTSQSSSPAESEGMYPDGKQGGGSPFGGDGANGSPPFGGGATALMTPQTQAKPVSLKTRKKLSRTYTRGYKGPMAGLRHQAVLNSNEPLFFRYWIPAMMRDPHMWYGIEMLKGPIISKAKFTIESEDSAVQEYAQRQLNRFLTRGLPVSLKCLIYGYCGLETKYKFNRNQEVMDFDKFHYIHPNDVRPVLEDGELRGMMVRRIQPSKRQQSTTAQGSQYQERQTPAPSGNSYQNGAYDFQQGFYLGLPKIFWAVHDKTYHPWYGRSRLEGAFIPWYETWQPQGFRNIRHLWMYKNAFDSGVIKYPEGSTQDEYGNEILNIDLATQMLDRKETGGGFALPSTISGEEGGWDWIPPEGIPVPDGLFEYGDSLRDEKWEGIGVPPEVAKSEDSGSFAGRRVPQQAFYSFLQEIANEQVFDWDEQCLQFLVRLAFGPEAEYTINPIPILLTLQQEEMGTVTGHMPGDENDDFYSGGGASEPGMDGNGGSEFQEEPLSNGRIEDRSTNGFNKAEQIATKNSKSKKKKK